MPEVEWRVHEQAHSKLELPRDVTGGVVSHTNPELTTIALYRGWVGDDAFYASVTTRPRRHSSLRAEARELSRHFTGGAVDGDEIPVDGARGARRVDGLMDIEEGYGDPPDWTERVTCVVAGLGPREVAILTLRRHPDPDLASVVDRIVASFALLG
jgi:hypothetical protein